MKKMILMLMTFTLVIAGCGSKKVETVNVPVSELMDGVVKQAEFNSQQFISENIKENTEIAENLNIDPASIEEGQYFKAMISVRADEIIILKAADESKVEELKSALEKEVSNQEQIWSTYLPDQYEKVQNHIIKQQGNYLILIIADEPEKLEQTFVSMLTPESK
ncbi:DUF4358 domain-containing protein [Paenibacillus sp. Marseille-Q4541]|uniref:DUF4358 domain-containing protein n=1 Tax=Paenibacillus sp. Marseille-Q4541 TaxID=2831522 RepID=UPI001BA4C6F4|nr:DUF4358 domain-containing protein [Paenibacillus sp. Marseille-Q4541]